MPTEVSFESGGIQFKATVYLMEFHSLGGHSGSPVFFIYPMNFQSDSGFDTGYIYGLLGLTSAHYDVSTKADKLGDVLGEIQVRQNSGIAAVTPAPMIRQLLERDELVDERKEMIKQALAAATETLNPAVD